MKIKKLNKLATEPEVVNGIILFKAVDIAVEAGRDNKVVLGYKTGLSVTMNEDEIGILIAPERAIGNSLYLAGGTQAITSSNTDELIIRYKVNTDGIPSLFEQHDVIARMIIVKKSNIDFEFDGEIEEPADTEKKGE